MKKHSRVGRTAEIGFEIGGALVKGSSFIEKAFVVCPEKCVSISFSHSSSGTTYKDEDLL